MSPQSTQGDKKDTINPNVASDNVEFNFRDFAALDIDAQEDGVQAEHLLFASFQGMESFIAHERETLRQLEERCAELIREMENVRLQIESILKQDEADQAKLDKEIEENINMNFKPQHNLSCFKEAPDGNLYEVLPKDSGQECNIIPITEPGLVSNNERHDELIDEPEPNANKIIDNYVAGAETDNELTIDIKQDTQEQLEAGNQQFATEKKLLQSGSSNLRQEEQEELADQLP